MSKIISSPAQWVLFVDQHFWGERKDDLGYAEAKPQCRIIEIRIK